MALAVRVSEITPPAAEPLTMAQLKAHCVVTHDNDDALLALYGRAARLYVEAVTRRLLITRTVEFWADGFPHCRRDLWLPRAPIQSVTWVKYYDQAGTLQTLSSAAYSLESPGGEFGQNARLILATDYQWPATQCRSSAVMVRAVGGYGDEGDDVAEGLRGMIRLLVAHWHSTREAVVIGGAPASVPHGFDALMWMYRIEP